ncbi:MAG: hypothetical protein LIP05_10965 [Tannerellaceae bacterium]|nr:hypothetical protein [Tannerellaceae bacterium]
MIIQQDGRYYIVFHEAIQLNDIVSMQNQLIELLKVASTSQAFDGAKNMVFHICVLLEALSLDPLQADYLERHLWDQSFHPAVIEEIRNELPYRK